MGYRINIVCQVDVLEPGGGERTVQQFEQQTCMFVQDGHLHAVAVTQDREPCNEAIVLVTLGIEGLFRTGDKEKRVVHDIRADDSLPFGGLFYNHITHVRQHNTVSQFAVGHNNHIVVF